MSRLLELAGPPEDSPALDKLHGDVSALIRKLQLVEYETQDPSHGVGQGQWDALFAYMTEAAYRAVGVCLRHQDSTRQVCRRGWGCIWGFPCLIAQTPPPPPRTRTQVLA